jgi:hypothetical protein
MYKAGIHDRRLKASKIGNITNNLCKQNRGTANNTPIANQNSPLFLN